MIFAGWLAPTIHISTDFWSVVSITLGILFFIWGTIFTLLGNDAISKLIAIWHLKHNPNPIFQCMKKIPLKRLFSLMKDLRWATDVHNFCWIISAVIDFEEMPNKYFPSNIPDWGLIYLIISKYDGRVAFLKYLTEKEYLVEVFPEEQDAECYAYKNKMFFVFGIKTVILFNLDPKQFDHNKVRNKGINLQQPRYKISPNGRIGLQYTAPTIDLISL